MAFKTAATLGFKEAMAKADPIVLELVSEIVVTVTESYQGDVMGDLNAMRGRIQGSGTVGNGEVEIVAMVPTSEILRYTIDLRSMTGGRGRFSATHSRYDPVPAHLVEKVTS
jgi:elongation factor G